MQLHDITFCRVNNCFLETCEFNKCRIELKMQELRIVDFVFYCNHLCFSIFDKLVRQVKENVSRPPLSQAVSGRVKSKLYEELA